MIGYVMSIELSLLVFEPPQISQIVRKLVLDNGRPLHLVGLFHAIPKVSTPITFILNPSILSYKITAQNSGYRSCRVHSLTPTSTCQNALLLGVIHTNPSILMLSKTHSLLSVNHLHLPSPLSFTLRISPFANQLLILLIPNTSSQPGLY